MTPPMCTLRGVTRGAVGAVVLQLVKKILKGRVFPVHKGYSPQVDGAWRGPKKTETLKMSQCSPASLSAFAPQLRHRLSLIGGALTLGMAFGTASRLCPRFTLLPCIVAGLAASPSNMCTLAFGATCKRPLMHICVFGVSCSHVHYCVPCLRSHSTRLANRSGKLQAGVMTCSLPVSWGCVALRVVGEGGVALVPPTTCP